MVESADPERLLLSAGAEFDPDDLGVGLAVAGVLAAI